MESELPTTTELSTTLALTVEEKLIFEKVFGIREFIGDAVFKKIQKLVSLHRETPWGNVQKLLEHISRSELFIELHRQLEALGEEYREEVLRFSMTYMNLPRRLANSQNSKHTFYRD